MFRSLSLRLLPLALAGGALLRAGTATGQPRDLRAAFHPASATTGFTDVAVYIFYGNQRVDPSAEVSYEIHLVNYSPVDAHNLRASFRLPRAFTFLYADFPEGTCAEAHRLVTCEVGVLKAASPDAATVLVIGVGARVPASSRGGRFELVASATSETSDSNPSNNTDHAVTQVYRHYAVTNTLDSGPGSLRAVLEAVNAECDRDGVPCHVDFAIPGPPPENGWFTIRPAAPLPPVTAGDVLIDGRTQTALTGDTNPQGPEIEISGDFSDRGSGLEIRSGNELLVAGLVINGFPENGLLIDGPATLVFSRTIRENYIGTDATGTRAIPNALRGIVGSSENFSQLDILNNVVSGNGRSGMLLGNGAFDIESNRIGTEAAEDKPLPNGASGIYLADGFGCAVITHNVIDHNRDMGIAAEYSRQAAIQQNSIKNNRLLGIDFGLDGESPDDAMSRPSLDAARYDAATNTTRIQGRILRDLFLSPQADLYSNSSPEEGQGDVWLGQAPVDRSGRFELSVPGSLLGRFITATTTWNGFDAVVVSARPIVSCEGGLVHTTTEFSEPIPVTR